MQLYSFGDVDLLNHDLANQIKNNLSDAVAQRGQAYFVVSGGKTPVDLFKILAKTKLPWDKVTVLLADERCVTSEDLARNERMVKDNLLQHGAKSAQFISLYDEQVNFLDGLQQVVQNIASLPTFDVVILGMGEDGHTASLFPCSEELLAGLDDNADAALLVNPKTAPYQRVSLSKKRLLNSRSIFLHLVGQKKREVLAQAMAESNPIVMPICAFLNHHSTNVQVMYAP